jgi:hypothetical protein
MKNFTVVPPVAPDDATSAPSEVQQREIAAIMHELKNQVCTIGLAIAALKYPDETEEDRRRHFASLEAVISSMNRQFYRLEDSLVRAGYKGRGGRSIAKAGQRALIGSKPPQDHAVPVIPRHPPQPFNNPKL